MKTILITGSNGFIGTQLKKHLNQDQYTIFEFNEEDGDIVQADSLSRFDDHKIDHIIHLAGKTFVPESWENPYRFYTVNVIGTMNVLEFCRKYNISLTFISTYLYGNPKLLPINENSEISPNNPYAHSKYLAEQLCHF